MATNEHGLDISYFKLKLNAITRDVRYYRPDEMARALRTLADVAEQQAVANQPADYVIARGNIERI